MGRESYQIEVNAAVADEGLIRQEVVSQTGSDDIFFCPRIVGGVKYEGHAHVFLPAGVDSPDLTPINL